jgi:hypothetical protein
MNEQSHDSWRDVLIARIQDAIWGIRGDGGLTHQASEHQRRIEALEQWRREVETIKDVARWMGLCLFALIGFLLTDPAARIIASIYATVAR